MTIVLSLIWIIVAFLLGRYLPYRFVRDKSFKEGAASMEAHRRRNLCGEWICHSIDERPSKDRPFAVLKDQFDNTRFLFQVERVNKIKPGMKVRIQWRSSAGVAAYIEENGYVGDYGLLEVVPVIE